MNAHPHTQSEPIRHMASTLLQTPVRTWAPSAPRMSAEHARALNGLFDIRRAQGQQ